MSTFLLRRGQPLRTWAPWFALAWSTMCSAAILATARRIHEVNYRLLLVPIVGSLFGVIPWPPRIRPAMRWLATGLVAIVVVLAVFSVGIAYLPAAFALFVVAS